MYLFFYDLETAGLDFRKSGIIQLGGIMVEATIDGEFKPVDKFNVKINPFPWKDTFEPRALQITGTTVEEIRAYTDSDAAFKKFKEFLSKYVDVENPLTKITLCGYNNSHFDTDFLQEWFKDNNAMNEYYLYFFVNQIDVMCEASRYLMYYRPAMANFKLMNVAEILGIEIDHSKLHNSMYDIALTLKLFMKLVKAEKAVMAWDSDFAVKLAKSQAKLAQR